MVIIGLTPGLANQMYEYAAAYAVSKELKQELVLDITECVNAGGGIYWLDFFSIPFATKMLYFAQDSEHVGHLDTSRIPKQLRERVTILTEEAQKDTILYQSLSDLAGQRGFDDVYLCGYFFNRDKYYDKYWAEIKKFFRLKVRIREVNIFQALIQDKISVGIHIRRGDMLLADWAEKMEDDYYRAAIEYCRRHLRKEGKECSFFVFSDDIAYAKKILGKDSSLWYVNFGGSREASIAEFVCLSLCNHRVLSNSSTFSRLADELSMYEGKKTFYQGKKNQQSLWTHIKKLKKALWLIFSRRKRKTVYLDERDIKKYSRHYRTNRLDNIRDYQKRKDVVLEANVTENNCKFILDEIGQLSVNAYERTAEEEKRFLYQKFIALVEAKEYNNALAVESRIYEDYCEDTLFKRNLVKALIGIGAYKEADIESRQLESRKHFVIIPAGKSCASGRRCGLVELGIVLHHFGHQVSFILEPLTEDERYYISGNELLTDRRGNCFGCRQYLQERVEKEGFERFLSHFQEDELFIITRKKRFCGSKFREKKLTYIFPDFMDWRDAESKVGQRMSEAEIKYLYDNADIIMTQEVNIVCNNREYIVWQDNDHTEEYWLEEQRWQFGNLERFSERTISMAEAIHEWLL